jgi:F0F1-type ATP synthase epsilon subunit
MLHLRVVTPSSILLDVRDAAWVRMQLADGGGIGILPGHGPLLAESVFGEIVFADASGEHARNVGAGILSIRDNEITILTIDSATAARARGAFYESAGTRSFQRLAKALYDGLGVDPGGFGQEQD